MKEIKIDVKKSGFPVTIGNVELWFDSSIEGLKRYYDNEKLTDEKLKEAVEKASRIKLPDEITPETIHELSNETIEEAFDINKKFVAMQYDLIFGDGTFEKVYAEHSDIEALENILDAVGEAISERLNQETKEKEKKSVARVQDHLKKKAKKK